MNSDIIGDRLMLHAIITGDIVNSRKGEPNVWLESLKTALYKVGQTPQDWEIYRGDSFQLITNPQHALKVAIQIKTVIKQFQGLDIRMGIGIGAVSYKTERITESNGDAFVNSGTTFDTLSKDVAIRLKSPWKDFDETINLLLRLLGKMMDKWSVNQALLIQKSLENPKLTQRELAEALNKKQGNISSSLTKAGYDELKEVLDYYESHILERINQPERS